MRRKVREGGLSRVPGRREIHRSLILPEPTILDLSIQAQPNDVTCGPTCLQAVYAFWQDPLDVQRVIDEVSSHMTRGSLAVLLGQHALQRGYRTTLYTYNLDVFDPTWFEDSSSLRERLLARRASRSGDRLHFTIDAHLTYLALGGELRYRPLDRSLLRELLELGPVLTGLSATYLYGTAREVDDGVDIHFDDVAGDPSGHFVVLHGHDEARDEVAVADPLGSNPLAGPEHHYMVGVERLLGAIMLGVLTYDGNLLVIEPAVDSARGPDAGTPTEAESRP